MNDATGLDRRTFLKVTATVSAGLCIGFALSTKEATAHGRATRGESFKPNAWLKIDPDDNVTIVVSESEMGQGVLTSMAMLVAEELDADWKNVHVVQAPVDPVYGDKQVTGGSTSVRRGWHPLREAGAVAREMLVTAAAITWGVPEETCQAESGAVVHRPTGRRISYGALTKKAAILPVPGTAHLKDPGEFRLLGKPLARLDTPPHVNGSAMFTSDMQLPGMLVATVTHCPVLQGAPPRRKGGKARAVAEFFFPSNRFRGVKRLDASKAMAVNGVRRVVQIDRGVAVVADNYWAARRGQQALVIEWDEGPYGEASSASISRAFERRASQAGEVGRNDGNTDKALADAADTIEAVYEVPYQAHATMEPMTCVAHVHKGGCDVWAPTQAPTAARRAAARFVLSRFGFLLEQRKRRSTGRAFENVRVHTTLLGGGFGRRLKHDFVEEAVQISKAVDAPVKLLWSREEDIQHDFYRPATYHRLAGALDERGIPVAWFHRVVGDDSRAARELPYAIRNVYVDHAKLDTPVPVGPWRSIAHSHSVFVTESFVDELAVAGGNDPYELRLRLLEEKPRRKGALRLAAEKAGWGKPLPEGRYQGIAVHKSFGSSVAQVAEVSVDDDGAVRVHRVVCAIDCGMVVNPDTVEAQMESAIAFGLTAALKSAITIENGRVEQSNFHDFPILTIGEMPVVETYIVPSKEHPGGVGEPGVPPIAPAVANAVYAATGVRVRKLPIFPEDLRPA